MPRLVKRGHGDRRGIGWRGHGFGWGALEGVLAGLEGLGGKELEKVGTRVRELLGGGRAVSA